MAEPLAEIRAATGFLTRLPVASDRDAGAGAAAFGLVGAAIGLAAAIPLLLLGRPVPLVAAVLGVAVVVVLSGAVHLDGLADTADALAAPSPELAERARSDPRLGAAGVVAVVLGLALAIAALATLAARDGALAGTGLVAAATVSRSAAPVTAVAWARFGPGGAGAGAGAWFVGLVGPGAVVAVVATSLLVIAGGTTIAGPAVAVGTAWGIVAAVALGGWVVARRGQLDGDAFGALIELTFLAVLTGIAVAGSLA